MSDNNHVDYYEVLHVSATADAETIHRVYRLLAQRFHPDNRGTGDPDRFRLVGEAFAVLGDADRRADYDANFEHSRLKSRRGPPDDILTPNDFESEQSARLAVLETLYTQRRVEPNNGALYDQQLEEKLGVSRERLEFTIWYLREKGLVRRSTENSRLTITAEGADFLEHHYDGNVHRRLHAARQSA